MTMSQPSYSPPYSPSYPTRPPKPFWGSPRSVLVILSVACILVFCLNPIHEDTIHLPREWDDGSWQGIPAARDHDLGAAFIGAAAGGKLVPTMDEWDAIKLKQQEARVRKEAWERKKHDDEDEARRRKEEKLAEQRKLEEERKQQDEGGTDEDKKQHDEKEGQAEKKQQEDKSTSKQGSTEEQKKTAQEQLKAADASDPANNGKYSAEGPMSNSSTSGISLSIDEQNSGTRPDQPSRQQNITTTLVVGRLVEEAEDVKWIDEFVEDLTHKRIYVVDDPEAPLHLKKNKGREAMVYLRYILDFYDNLDDVTLFYHSSRMAWHNNVLFNRDAAVMINNLRRDYILEVGYMNARCELYPGCQNPGWIKWNPTVEETMMHPERGADLFNEKLWDTLFPNRTRNPVMLSQSCCSQFAASRDTIRRVPLAQYQRIHDWLGTTDEIDGYTGRIMEYIWQYLFLNVDEKCPSMNECYCKAYGTCLVDDTELREYNSIRIEVDELLTKLGDVNNKNGCTPMEDEVEKDACRAGNPYEAPLKATRDRKHELERTLPEKYGIIDPLGR